MRVSHILVGAYMATQALAQADYTDCTHDYNRGLVVGILSGSAGASIFCVVSLFVTTCLYCYEAKEYL